MRLRTGRMGFVSFLYRLSNTVAFSEDGGERLKGGHTGKTEPLARSLATSDHPVDQKPARQDSPQAPQGLDTDKGNEQLGAQRPVHSFESIAFLLVLLLAEERESSGR